MLGLAVAGVAVLIYVVVCAVNLILNRPFTWTPHEAVRFPVFSKGYYPKLIDTEAACAVQQYHTNESDKLYTQAKLKDYVARLTSPTAKYAEIWIRHGSGIPNDVYTFVGMLKNGDVTEPFVLITSDGDNSPTTSLYERDREYLLDSEMLITWYSQNCDMKHPKLRPIPIGLDLHSPAYKRSKLATSPSSIFIKKSSELLNIMQKIRFTSQKRINKILFDVGSSSHSERAVLRKWLKNKRLKHVLILDKRMHFAELWSQYYSRYVAGISVRGNGLDCHRTWEMLSLGMVPILRRTRTPFDDLFKDLPALLVDKWSDLESTAIFDQLPNTYGSRLPTCRNFIL